MSFAIIFWLLSTSSYIFGGQWIEDLAFGIQEKTEKFLRYRNLRHTSIIRFDCLGPPICMKLVIINLLEKAGILDQLYLRR